ncbi:MULTISPECIES: ABC transporter ATP-binding protein [unclassified Streptomyces]|uniref:ABC transporter ATP-binding protein n=1 Tax=unclassified Streptomyces TaxID=2593676 RepID=UPI00278C88E8|nr:MULTISPECIES: ABC transporter ATP-binding protein [unclassified Streptomyces]
MSEPAIAVERLGRVFTDRGRDIAALRDVSFQVEAGEIVGLLGSNGAGKTTLTKILATLLLPTTGVARIFGHDVTRDLRAVRRVTGVVLGGDRGLYAKLNGRDNLRFFAMLAGVGRRGLRAKLDAALEEVGLVAAADRAVETYSKGMRQRLHIAIGMIAEPRVLLLDEPTVGLDPVEAERLRGTVAALRDTGVSVLLTSHYLLDIERLASRVIILADGTLAADLPVEDFARQAGYTATVTVRGTGSPPDGATVSSPDITVGGVDVADGSWTLQLHVRDWSVGSFGLLQQALAHVSVLDVRIEPVRLEDVYSHVAARLTTGSQVGGVR